MFAPAATMSIKKNIVGVQKDAASRTAPLYPIRVTPLLELRRCIEGLGLVPPTRIYGKRFAAPTAPLYSFRVTPLLELRTLY